MTAFNEDDSLGGNTAVCCPYCSELTEIYADISGGQRQDYVEDCIVCCRPIRFIIAVEAGSVSVRAVADS